LAWESRRIALLRYSTTFTGFLANNRYKGLKIASNGGPTSLKSHDLIVIGTGSAMNVLDSMLRRDPSMRIAVIDKDEPGGICLTRGCIPSKILLYPAELVRHSEEARSFGIQTEIKGIDFAGVMERMRSLIGKDIEGIRKGLSSSASIDYYHDSAEFVSPYTLKVGTETVTSKTISCAWVRRPSYRPSGA
jgi:mycothione reductase